MVWEIANRRIWRMAKLDEIDYHAPGRKCCRRIEETITRRIQMLDSSRINRLFSYVRCWGSAEQENPKKKPVQKSKPVQKQKVTP